MTPEQRVTYLESVIAEAARNLRSERPHLTESQKRWFVATDLEDSLSWSLVPSECAHPFWNAQHDGHDYCRTCGKDMDDDA